ncbi:DUF1398 family protein [Thiolinea disciformis]|uniref:DUF1398 family protein n=1 Tax=Thiolinea disciformis TaxID=125614 RepID=UPI000368D0E3|nr:DUF1398 family protein [Thiolinea disciformis]
MDKALIQHVSDATLASRMAFPEVVGNLLKADVDYYYVDYVKQGKTFYSNDGQTVETLIHYQNLPPIARALDKLTLKTIILDSQVNHQSYEIFTRRSMAAGVVGYFAFLNGRRVVYWGRDGESHTEYFPD